MVSAGLPVLQAVAECVLVIVLSNCSCVHAARCKALAITAHGFPVRAPRRRTGSRTLQMSPSHQNPILATADPNASCCSPQMCTTQMCSIQLSSLWLRCCSTHLAVPTSDRRCMCDSGEWRTVAANGDCMDDGSGRWTMEMDDGSACGLLQQWSMDDCCHRLAVAADDKPRQRSMHDDSG